MHALHACLYVFRLQHLTIGVCTGSLAVNCCRISFTDISPPALPFTTPRPPWAITETTSSAQSALTLSKQLSIKLWSSRPSDHSIFMTSHPAACRASSKLSASSVDPCLSRELYRITPYLLLFICLYGMMYSELWGDNSSICSTVIDSVSVMFRIWSSWSRKRNSTYTLHAQQATDISFWWSSECKPR